jgi:hypothetical protein
MSQCLCSVCGEKFSGVGGFDKHRKDFRCQPPEAVGLVLDERGVWRAPITDAQREKLAELRALSVTQPTKDGSDE